MIFGHSQTSHGIKLVDNVFAYAGCVQNRNDKGGIAIMCPGGHKPDGLISGNSFFTCPNVSAIFVNPSVPDCDSNMTITNNTMQLAAHSNLVTMPQVSFNPPAPTSNATSGTYNVIGACETEGATIRYTLDGSRPNETSPILPMPQGINLAWPGPALVVNMRAFKEGHVASVTNGAVVELNYGLGRGASKLGLVALGMMHLSGKLDASTVAPDNITFKGWAVDALLPGAGMGAVTVVVSVDGKAVHSMLANDVRQDLVVAKVAPNAEHGFHCDNCLPFAAKARMLSKGKHVLEVRATGTPSTPFPKLLSEGSQLLLCDGELCPAPPDTADVA